MAVFNSPSAANPSALGAPVGYPLTSWLDHPLGGVGGGEGGVGMGGYGGGVGQVFGPNDVPLSPLPLQEFE